jgi:hypothetical protein
VVDVEMRQKDGVDWGEVDAQLTEATTMRGTPSATTR